MGKFRTGEAVVWLIAILAGLAALAGLFATVSGAQRVDLLAAWVGGHLFLVGSLVCFAGVKAGIYLRNLRRRPASDK